MSSICITWNIYPKDTTKTY